MQRLKEIRYIKNKIIDDTSNTLKRKNIIIVMFLWLLQEKIVTWCLYLFNGDKNNNYNNTTIILILYMFYPTQVRGMVSNKMVDCSKW